LLERHREEGDRRTVATTQSTRKGVELSRETAAAATQRVAPPRERCDPGRDGRT
jgi:hypothetical protein